MNLVALTTNYDGLSCDVLAQQHAPADAQKQRAAELAVGHFDHSGLEVTVNIKVDVSILFGLEVNVEAVKSYLVEVFMENSFVFLLTCVWCGVAFLRA